MPDRDDQQHAPPPDPTDRTPNYLSDIDQDIRSLMKQVGALKHALDQSEKQSRSAAKKMLLGFLEVADAFHNRFGEIDRQPDPPNAEVSKWVDKFRIIHKLLSNAMQAAEITPVDTIPGQKVNFSWHNVVEVVRRPEMENETVLEEIRRGYLWRGELLRAADIAAVRNQ